jgi:DNA topoisomerase VI subunit A
MTFIFVVEKGTIYNHFLEEEFPQKLKCIMVTAYGMPDERTRTFLRLLQEKTGLPIYGMADPDPYGIDIMKTYVKGSTSLAHCNLRLAIPAIHWIGIFISDIEELEKKKKKTVLRNCPNLNPNERAMLRNMLSDKYMLSDRWKEEIKQMIDMNKKTCFEILHAFESDFVVSQHLPFLIDRVMKSAQ